ncbi:MAG: orotate phosphoribosyltransferase [Thermonemataceae bacterium]|nr:orotate phosphoribosyltransferase [Thermonemataceae bacterium]
MNETEIAEKIAALLLDIEAIKLSPQQPFKWSSGWLSPVYCDNRLTLSYPDIRTFIKNAFVELIKNKYPDTELIAGVATAGIPQGALIADALNLPFVYVRSEAKKHGMTNLIEGHIQTKQKVIVIEDLVSTGGSSVKVIEALKEAGAEVQAILAIMTYGFELARKNFEEKNVTFLALSNYNYVLIEAVKRNLITEQTMASLQEWRKQPDIWQVSSM